MKVQSCMLLIGLSALLICSSCSNQTPEKLGASEDWPVYLADKAGSQYSQLAQITPENVQQLQMAWEYRTGDQIGKNRSQIQCNPIIIDGVLYGTSPQLKLFALDAATGAEKWTFDPNSEADLGLNSNRGVAYWAEGDDKRIFYTVGPNLFGVDAETGQLVQSFGNEGVVSLKTGLGDRAQELFVVSTTPGVIYKDLLIIGSRVSENSDAAPGFIRAFNVKTGELAWVFHTIPRPGEFGADTWPKDAYKTAGGANSWCGMALDEERGLVFVPTGSAAFDFWGGNRLGENLFANSLVALNANTGKRVWHFQTVHHDLWDRDLPSPPNLVQVEKDGKTIDAVTVATKSGYLFVFDRETGEPVFPIEERPVAASDLEGEEAWPTQPFPTKPEPFARQQFTEAEVTNISEASRDSVLAVLKTVRSNGQFVPPSREGTVIFPGFDGGAEWGGSAYDPTTNMLYLNANEMPWILTMVPTIPEGQQLASAGQKLYLGLCAACHGADRKGDVTGSYPSLQEIHQTRTHEEVMSVVNNGKGMMPGFGHLNDKAKEQLMAFLMQEETTEHEAVTDAHEIGMESNEGVVPYRHTGYNRFVDPEGYPAVRPPWGTLNAIDLNKGEIAWQVPLGEIEALTKRGIPKTGTENYGGPVVTAGGLIFIAASKDEHIRAFDKNTGEELWKYKLPAGGYATPAVYAVDGKQYVVIACGGGKMGTDSGDAYVAFAL